MISLLAIKTALSSTFGQVPRWAWLTLLVLSGVFFLRADARRDGYEDGADDRDEEIERKTDEQIRAAVEAENAITRDLNLRSLRDVTRTDPHNLGRLPYD